MNIQINNQQSAIGNQQFARGFSLTEVILAVGILAVGMLFIAGVFPVSIYFTTVATERTIAATVADEAFAKCRICFNNPDLSALNDTGQGIAIGIPAAEFSYPSTTPIPANDLYSKKYWWYPLFRRTNLTGRDVQVTVFVSRKVGATSQYHVNNIIDPNYDPNRPEAVIVGVSGTTGSYELTIDTSIDPSVKTFINDGYTIVDDATGQIYRVLARYPANDTVIKLDRPWRPDLLPSLVVTDAVWVVPPPIGGGRYPGIGVYQKIMRF
jgi:prepilin-type N-terminal cleavage/methylation domain-containing protein